MPGVFPNPLVSTGSRADARGPTSRAGVPARHRALGERTAETPHGRPFRPSTFRLQTSLQVEIDPAIQLPCRFARSRRIELAARRRRHVCDVRSVARSDGAGRSTSTNGELSHAACKAELARKTDRFHAPVRRRTGGSGPPGEPRARTTGARAHASGRVTYEPQGVVGMATSSLMFGSRVISVRRFFARPSGVSLDATGSNSP